MKIKKINKACLGIGKEILGIKWVFLKSIDQPIKADNPRLCLHIRHRDGREEYIPFHINTYYPITCEKYKVYNIPTLAIH